MATSGDMEVPDPFIAVAQSYGRAARCRPGDKARRLDLLRAASNARKDFGVGEGQEGAAPGGPPGISTAQALAVLNLLCQTRLAAKLGDDRAWAHALDDEAAAVLVAFGAAGSATAPAGAGSRADLLAVLAKRALRPAALAGAGSAAGRLAGVELCSRLIRAALSQADKTGDSPASIEVPLPRRPSNCGCLCSCFWVCLWGVCSFFSRC